MVPAAACCILLPEGRDLYVILHESRESGAKVDPSGYLIDASHGCLG